jgi:DNA polymerase (family X)
MLLTDLTPDPERKDSSVTRRPISTNAAIARRLREAAELLEQQRASPFRINAYRRAATTVEASREDMSELARRRNAGSLEAQPGIGRGIAAAIREMLATGRWSQLERLRGSVDPIALFTMVPGIGPVLAQRIHDALGIETLEALESAAHDGRLERVAGMGPRRLQGLRASLEAALGRSSLRRARAARMRPTVAELLAIDAEYRAQAAAGTLRRIAPKRFNPSGEAWLPILHAQRGAWHFTALYSNTARAHELGRTRDWVIIYYYDDDHVEAQCTVVTETSGQLRGKRVVRGREPECSKHYAAAPLPESAA